MIYRSEPSFYKTHFFAATFVSFWLTLCQTNAQSRETAFGQTHTVSFLGKYDRFALSLASGASPRIYFWTPRGSTLSCATIDSAGTLSRWRSQSLSAPIDEFMFVDFKPEHRHLGVGIDRVLGTVSLYPDMESDTIRPSTTIQLPESPGHILFGDLNNDNRTDFLVTNREIPGIIPFFGIGNDKFRQGKPFALDNAVGNLRLVHLNNDNLIDIVLYDWVRSEIHLLYGVGQGKFFDQAAIAVNGDVQDLEVSPLVNHGNVDIILSYSNPGKVEILEGNGMGEFKPGYRITLKEPFVSMAVADVNGDGNPDIMGLDGASMLRVYLNAGDRTFEDRLDFAGGRGISQWGMLPTNQEGIMNAILLDRDGQRVVWFDHAGRFVSLEDSVDFSTGARPRGVTIADVNGDGLNDLLLTTAGSSSLSMYFNRPVLGLMGQTSFALPASAHDIAFHSLRDSTAHILISYPESKQISSFTLDLREWSGTNATIGTERAVEFLYWSGNRKPAVDFYCIGPSVAATPASLTLFQEIESHQFVERSFRLSPSNTLLGAGVGLLNRDSIPDVAFVYRNNATGKYQLAISLGDTLASFKQKIDLAELPQKTISRSYLWLVDRAKDGRQDIVMLNDGPVSVLQRVRHLRESFYTPIDTIALNVQISDWAQMQFCDLDGDGNIDIIVNDLEKGELGWFRGKGTTFESFKPLCSVPRRSHFAVGDLNGDGTPDIAVTFGDQGIVRIYDGKVLLKRERDSIH